MSDTPSLKQKKKTVKMLATNTATHKRVKRYAALHKLTMQQAINRIVREACR